VTSDGEAGETALRALLRGPTAGERSRGITTEIPAEVRVLAVDLGIAQARVDLSGEFQEPSPPKRIALRVAQVVWTLTALREVRSVAFSIDGERVAVTTEDETAVDRPVTRSDYATLSPR
jgi:spore germination protein GerM